FGILVIVGVGLAAFGVWELSTVAGEVTRMGRLADNAARVLTIDHDIEAIRRTLLTFRVTDEPAAMEESRKLDANAVELLQAAAKATLSEERRRAYQVVEQGIVAYRAK